MSAQSVRVRIPLARGALDAIHLLAAQRRHARAMVSLWNWVMHWTGLDDGSGAWYLFWSGIVGDLALLGGIIAAFRIANCHVSGCYRVGLHHVEGTPYRTCLKHHPTTPGTKGEVTVEHIHEAHRKAHEA